MKWYDKFQDWVDEKYMAAPDGSWFVRLVDLWERIVKPENLFWLIVSGVAVWATYLFVSSAGG